MDEGLEIDQNWTIDWVEEKQYILCSLEFRLDNKWNGDWRRTFGGDCANGLF